MTGSVVGGVSCMVIAFGLSCSLPYLAATTCLGVAAILVADRYRSVTVGWCGRHSVTLSARSAILGMLSSGYHDDACMRGRGDCTRRRSKA